MEAIEELLNNPGPCDIPIARLPCMFPSIFQDANLKIGCGPGWCALLLNMLLILKKHPSSLIITHIAEHYASLSIHYEGGDDFTDEVIELAELASERICSVCGKRGRMQDINDWYSVVCDDIACFNARQQPRPH